MRNKRRFRQALVLANALVAAILLNQLAARWPFRIDLTEEQRYTIKPQTVQLLQDLDDEVFVEVFLDGELNPGFTRFRRAIRDVLEEFRVRSGGRVRYIFTDPAAADSRKAQQEFLASLISRGLNPLNIIDTRDGERVEKVVVPGALIHYGTAETAVNLLRNQGLPGGQATQALNQSIETLEFEFISGISEITGAKRFRVGWAVGHGESEGQESAAIRQSLRGQYRLELVDVPRIPEIDRLDVLIVARPLKQWPAADVFKLDQFIMRGGRVLFLLETNGADMRAAGEEDYYIPLAEHGLDDLLFRYGIRVNNNVAQDAISLPVPVVTGVAGGRSQITPLDWPFYPLASDYADHPVTRNLDPVLFRFAATLDTVSAEGINKQVLVKTSPYSRVLPAPVRVQVNDLREGLKPEQFNQGQKILACLLEGRFSSAFRNRFRPDSTGTLPVQRDGQPTRLVVMGDADVALNAINKQNGSAFPTGYDPDTRQTFSNEDLIMNTVAYLADDAGIINARNRKVAIRMLDKNKIREERLYWQMFNLAVPVLIMSAVVLGAWAYRRKRYTGF